MRIRNEAKTVSVTLLSARLAAFGIRSENIYRITLIPSNAPMFSGITLEYEQSGTLKSKTIDLLDLKAK